MSLFSFKLSNNRFVRLPAIGSLVVLMAALTVACGSAVDESELPTPVPTIAPFVTPLPPQQPTPVPATPTSMPTPVPLPEPTAEPTAEPTVEPEAEETAIEDTAADSEMDEVEAEPTVEPTEEPTEEPLAEDAGVEDAGVEDAGVEDAGVEDEASDESDLEDAVAAETEMDEAVAAEAEGDEADADEQDIDETDELQADEVDADEADTDEADTDEADTDEDATVIELPVVAFLQPTDNAVVPLTFTVKVETHDLALSAYGPQDADEDAVADADTADTDAAPVEDDPTDDPTDEPADSAGHAGHGDVATDDDAATEEDIATDEDAEATDTDAADTDAADTDAADTDAADTDAADTDAADTDAEDVADEAAEIDADATESDALEIDELETDETASEDAEAGDTEAGDTEDMHLFVLVNFPHFAPGENVPAQDGFIVPVAPDGSAELNLAPGTYILRLQLTDAELVALETAEAAEIVVVVRDGAAEQSVRFAMPSNHAIVPPEFDVVMAATGLTVEPIGEARPGAGHFHILIDEDFIEPGQLIPTDESHLHFGAGQLTTTLTLEPGDYVLRLQMADGIHAALEGDEYRDEIAISVREDAPRRQVMFIEPGEGELVSSPFRVRWAATGLFVEPIGAVMTEGRGHLHVLINEEFLETGEVIPTDDSHLHFGGGQMETTLTLEPGEYTLRLQMANGAHITLEGDEYRDEIEIFVVGSQSGNGDTDAGGDAAGDADVTDEDETGEDAETQDADDEAEDEDE